MEWLLSPDPRNPDKSRVEVYRKKQEEYTQAFEHKAEVYNKARVDAANNPLNTDVTKQRQEYADWVGKHHKTYNNLVQAAYMDWVTMGSKEEVEYYFAIVDNDSAMARIEASKVSPPPSLSLVGLNPNILGRNACVRQSSVIWREMPNTRRSG